MDNVEIKEEVKEVKKPAKKAAAKKAVKMSTLQIFMTQRNEARKRAGIKEPAYTEEEISKEK